MSWGVGQQWRSQDFSGGGGGGGERGEFKKVQG